MIREGTKPMEGRLNEAKYSAIVPGQKITFYDGDGDSDGEGEEGREDLGSTLHIVVISVTRHATFREMLSAYGVRAFLPDHVGSLEDAVEIYRSFPGYREGEATFGACAMRIERISNVAEGV